MSKFLLHALNTHDVRWMKYILNKKRKNAKGKTVDLMTVISSRRIVLKDLLQTDTVVGHYNQQSYEDIFI